MLKYLLVENKRINVYVLLVFGLFGAVKRTEAMDDPKKALERQLLFEHAKDDIKNLGLCLGRQERFFKAWNRLSDEEKAKIVQDESFCGGYYSLFEGYSAHRDYDDITYELMLHGADPSLQNKLIDETFLHRWFNQGLALDFWTYGQLEKHRRLLQVLKSRGVNFNVLSSQEGLTPLHYAAINFNLPAIELLLEVGADPTIQTKKGNTVLHFWIEKRGSVSQTKKKLEKEKLLLQKLKNAGLDFNALDQHGRPVLHRSALNSDVNELQLLIDLGADPFLRDSNQDTVLHVWFNCDRAIDRRRPSLPESKQLIKFLKELNFDFNAQNKSGYTPMHCIATNLDICQALIEVGADPTIQNEDGDTVAHLLLRNMIARLYSFNIYKEEKEKYLALFDKIVAPALDVPNNEGVTPLQLKEKFEQRSAEIIKRSEICLGHCQKSNLFLITWHQLSEKEKEKIATDDSFWGGYYGLFEGYSSNQSYDDVAHELIKYGADPSKKNKLTNQEFLYKWFSEDRSYSIWEGQKLEKQKQLLQLLKKRGINFNISRETDGRSLMHCAARSGNLTALELLFDIGVDPALPDKKGNTVLHDWIAIRRYVIKNDEDVERERLFLQQLKNAGVDFNGKNKEGQTPLQVLVLNSTDIDGLNLLVNLGADLFVRDSRDNTILHSWLYQRESSSAKNRQLIDLLKIVDFDFAAKNKDGETPLYIAAGQDLASCKLLLDLGADPTMQNENGNSILHNLFRSYGCPEWRSLTDSDLKTIERILQKLKEKKFNANTINWARRTILHEVAEHQAPIEIIEMVANLEVDLSVQDKDGNTPAHLLMQYMIYIDQSDAKADPRAKKKLKDPRWFTLFDKLVASVADVPNKEGITPLQLKEQLKQQQQKEQPRKFNN